MLEFRRHPKPLEGGKREKREKREDTSGQTEGRDRGSYMATPDSAESKRGGDAPHGRSFSGLACERVADPKHQALLSALNTPPTPDTE